MRELEPVYVPAASIAAWRPARADELQCGGLYVAGNLDGLAAPTVAVVGTRAASTFGKNTARTLAADLAGAGVCVVSGLALGIDGAAHEGALAAGGATIGVLGGGHRRFFPKHHYALALAMIAGGGAVLSPYSPDQPARPHHFLARNSVVAALADAVVVVEAPLRSGALNTAGWAAGRVPVLAFPGDIDRAKMAGCLELIRDGAILSRNADDVLSTLGLLSKPAAPGSKKGGAQCADPVQRKILEMLRDVELPLDTLIAKSAIAPADVLSAVTMLEMNGMIERREGSRLAHSTLG